MPASEAATENSSAANMLLVSVNATAGIRAARQSSGSFFSRIAPSSSEYSLCNRKWMNRAPPVIRADYGFGRVRKSHNDRWGIWREKSPDRGVFLEISATIH